MAVEISVQSTTEKPRPAARARPRWRAATMSWSELMATRISPADTWILSVYALELLNQVRQTFFQVERGRDVLQGQSQLHHSESHFGLDSYNYGFRSSQTDHVRNFPERPRSKRVHDVHGRNVHDDTERAKLDHLCHQAAPKLVQIRVGKRRLKRRNQKVSLLENGDFHFSSLQIVYRDSCNATTLYPNNLSACSIPPCKSPTVFILPKSTPMVTKVCAISGESPVTITVAPNSREASTVCTR